MSDNGDEGIFWGAGSSASRIEANRVSGSPGAALALAELSDSTVIHNHLAGNGDGVQLIGEANTVTSNVVSDARGCGDGCGFGYRVARER